MLRAGILIHRTAFEKVRPCAIEGFQGIGALV
jgi:hypothetical protein